MILLIIIFFISFGLTGVYRQYAIRKSIIDIPSSRSSHAISTPRGGGIAISISWIIAISFLFLRKEINASLFFALISGFPISAIGLVDDIITVAPIIRLFVQMTSSAMAIYFLGGLKNVDIGFYQFHMPVLFSIIGFIGLIWVTNLFNFLDGIDGYISAEIMFICLAAYILFGDILPMLLFSAVAGFLLWNWQPAKSLWVM